MLEMTSTGFPWCLCCHAKKEVPLEILSQDIRSGVLISRSVPEDTPFTDSVSFFPRHLQPPQKEEMVWRSRLEAYQREEEAARSQLLAVGQEMELLHAREALLQNRQKLLWQATKEPC